MSNSWRALAKMARDRIVASDPEDLGRILDVSYILYPQVLLGHYCQSSGLFASPRSLASA